MMEERTTVCYFDRGTYRGVLRTRNCQGCTFFKTEAEFNAGQQKAQEMLDRKGLESYMTLDNKITTRPKRYDYYEEY